MMGAPPENAASPETDRWRRRWAIHPRNARWLVLLFCLCRFPHFAVTDPIKLIRVVIDDNYPPFSFRDERGRLQGILKDARDLWSERTGIRVDLVAMDFSDPYATADVALFFREDLNGIRDAATARGFTVGVKTGDACVDWL